MTRSASAMGWAAAGTAALWFVVHTFIGGAEVAAPLRASDLPDAVRAPAWMVWHMVTLLLAFQAVLFAVALRLRDRRMLATATAMAACFAVAGLAAAPLLGLGYAALPQGFLFVVTAAFGAGAVAAFPAQARPAP